ncbi:30S ribosome-binding factor RbfA [Candidatus Neomarinimicrobiota bacterium]
MPDFHRASSVPRSVRLADEVQRILGGILQSKVQLPAAGLVTVTNVELSKDLRFAKIYVSFLNPELPKTEIQKKLIRQRKTIRYYLGSELQAKYVPELRFYIDESFERSARIHAVIEAIHDGEKSDAE